MFHGPGYPHMHESQEPAAGSPLDAFLDEFLARHRGQLVEHARWVMRGVPRFAEPEDVVQAGALSFCLYLRKQQEAMVEHGLLTPARQCVETAMSDLLKFWQAQKRRPEIAAAPLPSSSISPAQEQTGPATSAGQHERQQRRQQAVQQVIKAMEPLDRRIMELRLEDEELFTFKRIGELVQMKEDAVRMRYRRAIQWMKARLPELLPGDSEFGPRAGGDD